MGFARLEFVWIVHGWMGLDKLAYRLKGQFRQTKQSKYSRCVRKTKSEEWGGALENVLYIHPCFIHF